MSSLKNDRFLSHSDYLEQNFDSLLSFYLASLAGFVTLLILLWLFCDRFWRSNIWKDTFKDEVIASSYFAYIGSDRSHRWLYYSYIVSIVHSLGCVYYTCLSLFSCEPPSKYAGTGLLGNTFVSNDYCVDNPSLIQG